MLGVLDIVWLEVTAEPMCACEPAVAGHEDRTESAHQILASAVGMLSSASVAVLQGSAGAGQTNPARFIQQR